MPKAGGGTYWEDDEFDNRDYVREIDSNQQRKREMIAELMHLVQPNADIDQLLKDKRVRDCQFMDALEYGRVVHAEMCALSDAARLGHSVKHGVLYTTTFPCHMCAKHIVAAGIDKIVFLEPYPKSLAADLHSDSIIIEGGDRGHFHGYPAVKFEHFHGVSPRRYRDMFQRGKRKDEDTGALEKYIGGNIPMPNIDVKYPFYANLEDHVTNIAMREIRKVVDDTTIAEA